MDQKIVDILTKEMPVIERIVNAYLTHHPDLDDVVVNGLRFGDPEPSEKRLELEKLTDFFDGDVEKATHFATKAHTNFGFAPATASASGGYKPCKDKRGNVFYIPVNQNCPK